MVTDEKIDNYTDILIKSLIIVFIICVVLLAIKMCVGFLLAISMTGWIINQFIFFYDVINYGIWNDRVYY